MTHHETSRLVHGALAAATALILGLAWAEGAVAQRLLQAHDLPKAFVGHLVVFTATARRGPRRQGGLRRTAQGPAAHGVEAILVGAEGHAPGASRAHHGHGLGMKARGGKDHRRVLDGPSVLHRHVLQENLRGWDLGHCCVLGAKVDAGELDGLVLARVDGEQGRHHAAAGDAGLGIDAEGLAAGAGALRVLQEQARFCGGLAKQRGVGELEAVGREGAAALQALQTLQALQSLQPQAGVLRPHRARIPGTPTARRGALHLQHRRLQHQQPAAEAAPAPGSALHQHPGCQQLCGLGHEAPALSGFTGHRQLGLPDHQASGQEAAATATGPPLHVHLRMPERHVARVEAPAIAHGAPSNRQVRLPHFQAASPDSATVYSSGGLQRGLGHAEFQDAVDIQGSSLPPSCCVLYLEDSAICCTQCPLDKSSPITNRGRVCSCHHGGGQQNVTQDTTPSSVTSSFSIAYVQRGISHGQAFLRVAAPTIHIS